MDEFEKQTFAKIVDLVAELYGYINRTEEEKYSPCPTINGESKVIRINFNRQGNPDADAGAGEPAKPNKNLSFEAEQKEVKKIPPQYKDGSFRKRGNLLEYRFIFQNETNEKVLKSVYGHSEKECFDKRTALIAGKGKPKKQKQDNGTYKDWLAEWYKVYKLPYNGERSLESISRYINNYIVPGLGDKQLHKMHTYGLELQQFINAYADKPNTQSKIYNVLHESLEQAYILQKIKFNTAKGLKLMPHKKQSYRALEIKEQSAIYNAIDNKDYKRLFMFCCCTGIRISRVLELTDEHFDQDRKEIVITKKQRRGLSEVYKVPYLPSLVDLSKPGKIFPNLTYTKTYNYFYALFKQLHIKKANLHCFRHTFLSVCYFIGINDKVRQMWAGHSTFEMTMDVYTHLLDNGDNSPVLDYLRALKQELKL